MTAKKYFYVMVAALVLLGLLIAGGAVGGNMLLEKQSRKLSDLKVENETLEQQQTALIQAKADVERYAEIEKIAKSVVPQDKDQAKTVREILQIAAASGVPIKSVSFPVSTLGNAPQAGATQQGATTATKQPTPSQLKPVEGIAGVYTLEIQIESNGRVSYQSLLRFLEGLEKNRRTAHVSGINLSPFDNGNRLEFDITLNAYVKP